MNDNPDNRIARLARLPFHQFRSPAYRKRLVLISRPETAAVLMDAMSDSDPFHSRIELVAVDDGRATLFPATDGARSGPDTARANNDDSAATKLVQLSTRIDRIVVADLDPRADWIAAALGQTEHLPHEVSLMQPGDAKSDRRSVFARENCVMLRGPAVGTLASATKRGLDLVLATLALLVLLPVLLLVSLAIRLESTGPILFRQPRGGLGGQPFTVFKFRTMWHDAAASDGSVQATLRDTRVTRVGRLLRKTSIDELPQLLNVLNGSMSLVGPRPHPLQLDRKFLPLVERYSMRHRVRPGITGWAQVNGARGETRTVDEMARRVALDIEYIGRQSLAFDLRILLLTFLAVIRTEKVY